MSSAEEDGSPGGRSKPSAPKKRRVALACDMCRKRKIRCDGKQPKCTSCSTYNWDCSYVDATKKFQRGYVEALEAKNRKLEALIKRLHPAEDFSQEVGFRLTRENWTQKGVLGEDEPSEPSAFATEPQPKTPVAVFVGASSSPCKPKNHAPNEDFQPSDDEDNMSTKLGNLTNDFKSLTVGGFHGKSSGARLIKAALRAKEDQDGTRIDKKSVMAFQRPQYWRLSKWERDTYEMKRASYTFPEGDLLFQLFDLYFQHLNTVLPVLHRPTLEAAVISGSHLVDEALGGVVLLVCANGARYSEDRRVCFDYDEGWHSAGWKYFEQVRIASKSLVSSSRLYDLQISCLGTMYLMGCSAAHACWNLCGIGIRLAQDVGAHRRKVYSQTPTAEDELFKRAFWVLLVCDRWLSSALGRPCAIQEEDFDLEMPIDVDDEYWVTPNPEDAFKQPEGKPSKMTAFICQLKLCQVLGFALRTIYTSNKAKAHFGFIGPDWEQKTITNFDSILNRWADQVPEYLRWDPKRKDDILFMQSAHLWAQYYDLQIVIHRPFIAARISTPLAYPSLAICTNAARSASHVVGATQQRYPNLVFPHLHKAAFSSAVVLLIGVWNAARYKSTTVKPEREMAAIQRCLDVLKALENRWHAAGRLWDILHSLVSVGTLPTAQDMWPKGNALKRPHEDSAAAAPGASPETTNSTPSSLGHMSDTFTSSSNPDSLFSGSLGGRSDTFFGSDSSVFTGTSPDANNDLPTFPGSDNFFASMLAKAGGLPPPQPPARSTADRPTAGSNRVQAAQPDATLPIRSDELGRMDASDPMLSWNMDAFNAFVPQPSASGSGDAGASSAPSMFAQPDSDMSFFAPSSSTQDQQQQQSRAPLAQQGDGNVDLGALFGFGAGADMPQPQLDPSQSHLLDELLQGVPTSAGGLGGSGAMDVWSGAGNAMPDWYWMYALGNQQPGLQMQQDE
ncbi:hypothetical protein PENSPDRAFT_690958 [Peniophora sp. CONT]|nr:hypothetical protein PENSPDRAFT_690958 [Peniophora sp. CONT]